MSRKGDENAGNALAAQAAFERELFRVAQVWHRVDMLLDRLFENDIVVRRLSVVVPTPDRDGFTAIVTATVSGEPCVAFHGGTTFVEAMTGLLNRLENGSVKWKIDQYGRS